MYFNGLSAASSEGVWKFWKRLQNICEWRYILQVKDDLFQTWPVNVSGDKDGLKKGGLAGQLGKTEKN